MSALRAIGVAVLASTLGLWAMAAPGSSTVPNLRREYHSVSRTSGERGGSSGMRVMGEASPSSVS